MTTPPETPRAASETEGQGSIRSRAVRGAVWSGLGFGTQNLLRLGSNLLLTRLLFPEAFGLMALVNVTITGLYMFSDLGLVPVIVQSKRGDDPRFLQTAWTIQVLRGLLLFGVAASLAWPMASFYGQPELLQLIPGAAVSTLILGFESTMLPRLQRHLRLALLTALEIGAQVVAIAVMLTWALSVPTVWALVGGSIASAVVRTVASHLINDRREGFGWEPKAVQELVQFGKWIFISTVLAFLAAQLDRLILGRLITIQELGVYSIGLMFALMPGDAAATLGTSVVFPALARKLEGSGIGEADARARFFLLALVGIAVACLAAAAPHLIAFLYDDRYHDAGWMLRFLVLGVWFRALEVPPGVVLLAMGHTQWIAAGQAAKVVGVVALLPLGFALSGIHGAVLGLAASQVLLYLTVAIGARRAGVTGEATDVLMTGGALVASVAGMLASAQAAAHGLGPGLSIVVAGTVAMSVWLPFTYAVLRLRGGTLAELDPRKLGA